MGDLSRGTRLGPWKVGKRIGEGACAKVYEAELGSGSSSDVSYPVVAKVIPLGSGKGKKLKDTTRVCNTLNYEKDLYNGMLLDFPFRPQNPYRGFFGDDKELGVRYLVLERLGCDLTDYATGSSSPPSHTDVATIGIQILEGMRLLHNKGYLFVDSKPQNFMLKNNDINDVKFVDFGCAERWMSYNGTGARAQNTRALVGTPEFASVSCMDGNLPTRIDDLESMCLVLISLTSGAKLPWNTATSEAQCRDMMKSHDIKALCAEGDVAEVGEILLECRSLVSDDTPNYEKYDRLLKAMRDRSSKVKAKAGGGRKASAGKREASSPLRESPKAKSSKPRGGGGAKVAGEGKSLSAAMDVDDVEEDGEDDEVVEVSRKVPARGKGSKAKAAAAGGGGRGGRRATMVLDDDQDSEEEGEVHEADSRVLLKVLAGAADDSGRELELHAGGITRKAGVVCSVGRGEHTACSFSLADDFSSDVHCSFRVVAARDAKGRESVHVCVKDERTTNGTKVNNTKLSRSGVWMPISPGDEVKIGKTRMQLVLQ